VRELFRRRRRAAPGLVAAVLLAAAGVQAATKDHDTIAPPSIKITSPLGRSGLPGTIRIVARLDALPPTVSPVSVTFAVDGKPVSTDSDGAPYEATWVDENPFETREITAEATLSEGKTIRDAVTLKPLEITEAADVSSVAVEVTVVDASGRFVTDLGAEDFVLREDGTTEQLDFFRQQRDPALFTLLVDSSHSMSIRAEAVRAAARRFLSSIAADDQVVVAPFSRTITSITGPTSDHATVLQAIAAIKNEGGTAILDALRETVDHLTPLPGRRAVVLITDGYDEHSQLQLDMALKSLNGGNVPVYVIGFGGIAGISLNGEKLLNTLAGETGGRAWFPRDEPQLGKAYETIATEVQHRYFLTYTPHNQRRDGTWRKISVEVRKPSLKVRARNGYNAPKAPPVRPVIEFTAIGASEELASVALEDLVVLEDGVEQKVETFEEAVDPVTVVLALDSSGSMKQAAAQAQAAARDFVNALRPEDRIAMISFANRSVLVHPATNKREETLKAIDAYVATGGTALNDGLYDSLAQVSKIEGRRAIVVVTDGRDENAASNGPGSTQTWNDVVQQLEQTQATIYAIGLGTNVDKSKLQTLAEKSGGRAFFPADVTTLAASYHKIVDELRRRYVIGYESTNSERNGRWRKLEIQSREGDLTIRSRGGYYAPAADVVATK
jgi:VWFA-related protein